MAARSVKSDAAQLAAFIAKFDAKDQRLIRAARKFMRKRLPSAHELVYDNYNFLVIGYSPTPRPSQAIFSVAARANGLNLFFLRGVGLPDPARLLQGAGKQVRFVRIESAADLTRPAIEVLMSAAIRRSKPPLAASGRGTLVVRAISAKQRSRRKTPTV